MRHGQRSTHTHTNDGVCKMSQAKKNHMSNARSPQMSQYLEPTTSSSFHFSVCIYRPRPLYPKQHSREEPPMGCPRANTGVDDARRLCDSFACPPWPCPDAFLQRDGCRGDAVPPRAGLNSQRAHADEAGSDFVRSVCCALFCVAGRCFLEFTHFAQ